MEEHSVRPADAERAVLRAGRAFLCLPAGAGGRAVHCRRLSGRGVRERSAADGRAIPARLVRRGRSAADVPHGGLGVLANGRAAGAARPGGPAGQGAGVPGGAWGDRGGAATAPRGTRRGGGFRRRRDGRTADGVLDGAAWRCVSGWQRCRAASAVGRAIAVVHDPVAVGAFGRAAGEPQRED